MNDARVKRGLPPLDQENVNANVGESSDSAPSEPSTFEDLTDSAQSDSDSDTGFRRKQLDNGDSDAGSQRSTSSRSTASSVAQGPSVMPEALAALEEDLRAATLIAQTTQGIQNLEDLD